jgi:Mor family transcriptional regulator
MPVKKLTQKQTESIRQQAQSGTSVAALCAKYNLSSTHIYRIKNNEKRNRRKTK